MENSLKSFLDGLVENKESFRLYKEQPKNRFHTSVGLPGCMSRLCWTQGIVARQ